MVSPNVRRAAGAMLAVLLLFFAGCGSGSLSGSGTAPTVLVASDKSDCVPAPELLASRAFRKRFCPLPGSLATVDSICTDAAYLYLLGSSPSEPGRLQLWRTDFDGASPLRLFTFEETWSEEKQICHHDVTCAFGGVCVRETQYKNVYRPQAAVEAGESDPPAPVLDHVEITERLLRFSDPGKAPVSVPLFAGTSAPSSVVCTSECIVLAPERRIRVVGANGGVIADRDAAVSVYALAAVGDTVYACTDVSGSEKLGIRTVDLTSGALSEPLPLSGGLFFSAVGAQEGKLVSEVTGDLFLFDPAENRTEKLVDWMDYDVSPLSLYGETVSDSGVVAAVQISENPTVKPTVVVLTPSAATVLPAGTLTLGVLVPDETVIRSILAFNQSGTGRIRLVDYSELDTMQISGLARMKEEIFSDRCPDLLYSPDPRLPVDALAGGRLRDLAPLLAADKELMGETIFPSVTAALQSGGALQVLAPVFRFSTAVGKTTVLGGEPLNLARVKELAASLPPDGTIADFHRTQKTMLPELIAHASTYLHKNSGEYNLSSQVFYDVLELTEMFASAVDWTHYSAADYNGWARVYTGDQLLLGGSFDSFLSLAETLHAVGDDAVLCGWPSTPGGHAFEFPITVGISTSCRSRSDAWQFVRSLMTAESQLQLTQSGIAGGFPTGFPTNKTAFSAASERAYENAPGTKTLSSGSIERTVSRRLTPAELENFRAAVELTTSRVRWDEGIDTITEIVFGDDMLRPGSTAELPKIAQTIRQKLDERFSAPNAGQVSPQAR